MANKYRKQGSPYWWIRLKDPVTGRYKDVSSKLRWDTAKVGLGGGVTGANYGNASQLKASQEAATHLKDIKAEITKLSSSVGLAS
jgi:hypothetical protein